MNDDDSTRIEAKVDKLYDALNSFKLKISVDMAKMEIRNKMFNFIITTVTSVIIAGIASKYFK